MSKKLYACIYGGASDYIADIYKDDVSKVGQIISEHGYSLVYGGGGTGCMGAAARSVRESGGYVMGVVPHFMSSFEELFDCDDTIMVDTMSERKTIMEKYADIFLIAPGGIGTMDEFFQILTLKHLQQLSSPIVVLNFKGFYDSLLTLIDDLIAQGAAKENLHDLFDVIDSAEDEKLPALLKEIRA